MRAPGNQGRAAAIPAHKPASMEITCDIKAIADSEAALNKIDMTASRNRRCEFV